MKKQFPGHFPYSKAELHSLWNSCIFVVDANILLNLYRYSDGTRADFLDLLSSIQERIWLPHRVAEEYFANRLSVIGQQEKTYDDAIRTINNLKQELENIRQHPFVSASTMRKASQVFDLLKRELQNNQTLHAKKITDDPILFAVDKLFKDNVGNAYDNARLTEILKEGKSRYTEKTPPGFKDDSKAGDDAGMLELCRKYGDLLVWFQIIDTAKEKDTSVILVTDDKKEDWWNSFKGKTIGPRPELVQEFLTKTGKQFHMYQADRFLELAREYLKHTISEDTVSEIKEVRTRDIAASREARRVSDVLHKRRAEYVSIIEKIDTLTARRMMLQKTREQILHHQNMLQDGSSFNGGDPEKLERYLKILAEMQSVEDQLRNTEAEIEASEKLKKHFQIERHLRGIRIHHDGRPFSVPTDETIDLF